MFINFLPSLKFTHTSPLPTGHNNYPTMSRLLAIRHGKKHENKSFSTACPHNHAIETLLESTLHRSMNHALCTQILQDIKNVTQFYLVWGDRIGYLMCPTLYIDKNDVTVVIRSFSDVIGQALPMSTPLSTFGGYFTMLAPKTVANQYHLPQSEHKPDAIPPPEHPNDAEDVQDVPTMARLHFYMGTSMPENRLVIAAFLHCLPIPPGCTYI
jgi:hypothetical protein